MVKNANATAVMQKSKSSADKPIAPAPVLAPDMGVKDMDTLQLPLKDGDTIVAAFPYRDEIFVISRYGKTWQLVVSEINGMPEIRRVR